MKKYLSILKISFQQEFAYRLNFVMWRIRNIIQILVFFFLWNSVYESDSVSHFGYTKEKIIAYVFLLIFVRAIVLSSRSVDVAGHVANGDLSNYLLKPVSYFKYWITRDVGSKILNVLFSSLEIGVLYLIFKPDIYIQQNILYILLFFLSLIIAGFIYFNIIMLTNSVPFWVPEVAWGAQFLVTIIAVEFLSGAFFPLDVLPNAFLNFLKLTPFPYLIFIPIKTYLGAENLQITTMNLALGLVWVIILWKLKHKVWRRGLKVYEAVGR